MVADPQTVAWTLAALLNFAPVEQHAHRPWGDELETETLARYVGISAAIGTACADDPDQRRCASLLVAIAIGESGLAKDADTGPCYRKGAYWRRCDAGAAASVWQVQGWYVDGRIVRTREIFADRALAAGQALKVARASLRRCSRLRPERQLSGLSGKCIDADGTWVSRWRLWQTVKAWTPTTRDSWPPLWRVRARPTDCPPPRTAMPKKTKPKLGRTDIKPTAAAIDEAVLATLRSKEQTFTTAHANIGNAKVEGVTTKTVTEPMVQESLERLRERGAANEKSETPGVWIATPSSTVTKALEKMGSELLSDRIVEIISAGGARTQASLYKLGTQDEVDEVVAEMLDGDELFRFEHTVGNVTKSLLGLVGRDEDEEDRVVDEDAFAAVDPERAATPAKRYLECKLSPESIEQIRIGREAKDVVIRQLREEIKADQLAINAKRKRCDTLIEEGLADSKRIAEGAEMRDVPVEIKDERLESGELERVIIRLDTNEEIERRALTAGEKQLSLIPEDAPASSKPSPMPAANEVDETIEQAAAPF